VFAYHAPEVEPSSAKGHPTLAPIRHAGPWEFRPHRDGGTLCLFAGTKDRLDAFDAPVEAEPGLRFLPPRQEVTPAMLARPAAGRPDATTVALASGQELAILPAYLEPRRVLSGAWLARSSGRSLPQRHSRSPSSIHASSESSAAPLPRRIGSRPLSSTGRDGSRPPISNPCSTRSCPAQKRRPPPHPPPPRWRRRARPRPPDPSGGARPRRLVHPAGPRPGPAPPRPTI